MNVMSQALMSDRVRRRLAALSADYAESTGSPFGHFFCPILYRDEETELCEAHIVNEAFNASSRWTVQRKDVDGFYGTKFESDFLALKARGHNFLEVIADPALRSQLRPAIMAGEKVIPYYAPKKPIPPGTLPPGQSRLIVDGPHGETHLVLKMSPSDIASTEQAKWRIEYAKDIRLAALVSLLKAAHLTLFDMLGYRYALSAGGYLLGKTILGNFFLASHGLSKSAVVADARLHFQPYVPLMRPILGVRESFKGTPDDHIVYVCERGSIRWAFIVVIRTGADACHGVLVPILGEPVAAKVFTDFLACSRDQEITARLASFRGDRWEAAMEPVTHVWPFAEMQAS